MLKRILAAPGSGHDADGPIEWAIPLAKEHDAAVTVLPITEAVDEEEELENLPACASLTKAGIRCRGLHPSSDVLGNLASESRYHDLLLFGLGDCYSNRAISDFTKAVSRLVQNGACPLLLAPPNYNPVKRVMIAYSGSTASARSFRRFIQSGIYASASVDLVCLGESLEDAHDFLKAAQDYLHEHGRKVNPIALRGSELQVVEHALQSQADLVVVGSNHRNALGIETSSQVLRAFLAQSKIPVFLSH
jgi:nucleotide-binding universal stress UspA family protein